MQLERIACVALAVLGLGLPPAHGDDYPTREVHVICAYAPGTGADTLVRFFAEKLRVLAGKPMIVENKPGAVRRSRPSTWRGQSPTATRCSLTRATAWPGMSISTKISVTT